MIRKLKTIKIKVIQPHLLLDTDGDKSPDYKDCRPFDKTKQDSSIIEQNQDYYYLYNIKRKTK